MLITWTNSLLVSLTLLIINVHTYVLNMDTKTYNYILNIMSEKKVGINNSLIYFIIMIKI